MCLLSYYPPGVMPWEKRLTEGASNNPHGSGFALITNKQRLITGKGMSTGRVIERFLEMRAANLEYPAMFHSRLGTGGRFGRYNCHPFYIGGDHRRALAHNGVLFQTTPAQDGDACDSRVFAERVIPYMYADLDDKDVYRQLQNRLGSFNKICILSTHPDDARWAYLLGEDSGDWDVGPDGSLEDGKYEGAWHSNRSWQTRNYAAYSRRGPWDRSRMPYYADHGDCDWCGSKHTIDPDSLKCAKCHICEGCWEYGVKCTCPPTPKSLAGSYVKDGKTGIYRPETAEESLAAYPARMIKLGWEQTENGNWRKPPLAIEQGPAAEYSAANQAAQNGCACSD